MLKYLHTLKFIMHFCSSSVIHDLNVMDEFASWFSGAWWKRLKTIFELIFFLQLWVSHKNIYMLSILNHINASLLTLKKSSCCACTFACTNLPLLMILWFWHWYTAVYIRWSYRYQYQRRNTRRNLCCCYRGQGSSARVL